MASPLAASLVTLTKAQKTAGVVLANIGAETLSIMIFDNDTPVSLKVFPDRPNRHHQHHPRSLSRYRSWRPNR